MFESTLEEKAGVSVIEGIVKKKFKEAGIVLNQTQIKKIAGRLENSEGDTTIDLSDVISSETTDVSIEILDEDVQEAISKIVAVLDDEIPRLVEKTADVLLKKIKRMGRSQVRGARRDRKKFERRLEKLWRVPLRLLEMFQLLVTEAGDEFNKTYRPAASASHDIVFDVLTRLHARACQIGSEVLVLLKAGLADGAHARWRTLHEVAIVAMFIQRHGEEVANQYLNHRIVESYKGALEYQKHYQTLGLDPFPDDEFVQIQSEYQKALSDYGSEFRTEYGWAAKTLGKKRPTFRDIEESVDLAKWRGYYKMASHNVHANPKGITFKLGLRPTSRDNILLAGSSNTGLADPAHGTALSLLQITTTLLLTRPNIDTLVRGRILMELQREIGDEFLKVHHQIEEYEARQDRLKQATA